MSQTMSHNELPQIISIFPLARALLLPGGTLPLVIFEARYLAMVNDALAADRLIGMIQPKQPPQSDCENPPLYEIGCMGRITSFQDTGDGRMLIQLTGQSRFRVVQEITQTMTYRQIKADYQDFPHDLEPEPDEHSINRDALVSVLRRYLKKNHLQADWKAIEQASNGFLVTVLSIISPYGVVEKQALLEAKTSVERCDILVSLTEMALAQNENDGNDENGHQTMQ